MDSEISPKGILINRPFLTVNGKATKKSIIVNKKNFLTNVVELRTF